MIESEPFEKDSELFSDAEAEYLAENFIGRMATSSKAGQPHVVPVNYRFDGRTITFGGGTWPGA